MDDSIRRHRMQLAECTRAVETSREMIALSRRWLTSYHDSVSREIRALFQRSLSEPEDLLSHETSQDHLKDHRIPYARTDDTENAYVDFQAGGSSRGEFVDLEGKIIKSSF